MGLEPSGRELLVVVVKGTFRIPVESGAELRLHEAQIPLVMSDVFFGEPGKSAPKYEVDFAPRKRHCDVLLNATAYAPEGRPVSRIEVGARVGDWSKAFAVVGDRVWEAAGVGIGRSAPIPFSAMPISYERAYGGIDIFHKDPAKHAAFMANPCGRGFHAQNVKEWIDGTPLPNTEKLGEEVTWFDGNYSPMSFGPIGRQWEPRSLWAGTYDQRWRDEVFPFLPEDFDERYYQSVLPDQQLPLPVGPQPVVLTNLTPEGSLSFVLPHLEAPVHIFPKKGPREDLTAFVDTIVIEPDQERVTMTWRVARPLQKNMFEIGQVLIGRKGPDWWQARSDNSFPIPIVVEKYVRTPSPEISRG
jgi:hypothetical protein